MRWIRRVFGGSSTRRLAAYEGQLRPIERMEPELKLLSDKALAQRSADLRERVRGGASTESLLPEAFALVREAGRRALGMRHYDVQLLGGMALHAGCMAEMKTGEGKTLAATLPAYLEALRGEGVHVVTVNDYLARRDSEWMGQLFGLLGMSVGCVLEQMGGSPDEELAARKAAYACDVTYGTNHELAFDYLRDNLALSPDEVVHRGFHYAIVDEVDFLLIDEARTPLIISGPAREAQGLAEEVDAVVRRLSSGMHYYVEDKTRVAALSDLGFEEVQQALGGADLTSPEQLEIYHAVQQSVRAHGVYKRDVDYIVRERRVLIVDEFTGRVSEDKRFADGLHQALEAKEGVPVRAEDRTLAKVTYQTFFGSYTRLCGMTGTAWTAREELKQTYGCTVVVVPTNMPMIREDYEDLVFDTLDQKHAALLDEIVELRSRGRPVLVGTTSVAESERLCELLQQADLSHEVLNAKNHQTEAALIAQAGRPGSVTISTNMAGRGVDILLGGNADEMLKGDGEQLDPQALAERCEREREHVLEQGGLHVIGTAHHESPRIDDQLRGRAGRQGDPGSSQLFISLDHELWRKFGKQDIAELRDELEASGHPPGEPLDPARVGPLLQELQSKVEEENRAIRREVLKYDLVVHEQREAIYTWRRTLVSGEGFDPEGLLEDLVADLAELHEDPDDLAGLLTAHFHHPFELAGQRPTDLAEAALDQALELLAERQQKLGQQQLLELGNQLLLMSIDELWTEHLTNLERVEEGIGLQGYAQQDPLVAWRREAGLMYRQLLFLIRSRTVDLWFLAGEAPKLEQPPSGSSQLRIRRKA